VINVFDRKVKLAFEPLRVAALLALAKTYPTDKLEPFPPRMISSNIIRDQQSLPTLRSLTLFCLPNGPAEVE
jgi:hypothetical protein